MGVTIDVGTPEEILKELEKYEKTVTQEFLNDWADAVLFEAMKLLREGKIKGSKDIFGGGAFSSGDLRRSGLIIKNKELEREIRFTADPVIITAAIIGMSGAHAATTKTPVASVLLILEITGLPSLIIPMILANISAYVVSGPRSLYSGQLRSRDAAIMKELKNYDQHEGFIIENVMTEKERVFFTFPNTTIGKIKELILESSKRDFPVVESEENLIVLGMIKEEHILATQEDDLLVKDVMTDKFPSVNKTMTGKEALQIMLDQDVERTTVVDANNLLIGIVSIGDIIRGHKKLFDTLYI